MCKSVIVLKAIELYAFKWVNCISLKMLKKSSSHSTHIKLIQLSNYVLYLSPSPCPTRHSLQFGSP